LRGDDDELRPYRKPRIAQNTLLELIRSLEFACVLTRRNRCPPLFRHGFSGEAKRMPWPARAQQPIDLQSRLSLGRSLVRIFGGAAPITQAAHHKEVDHEKT